MLKKVLIPARINPNLKVSFKVIDDDIDISPADKPKFKDMVLEQMKLRNETIVEGEHEEEQLVPESEK